MEDSAGVTLLSTMQYCSVARNRTRFECANEYGPLRGGGPEMLEHSDCHAPGRTGKTASRETEQNVNAAVLWTPYQRGLPEQVCLRERPVTKSRRLRGTGTRDEREKGCSPDTGGQTVPCSS